MENLQNECYYKNLLQQKISDFIGKVTIEDNELGYISDNMVSNMTEAAWLVLKQNVDSNRYFEKEGMLSL